MKPDLRSRKLTCCEHVAGLREAEECGNVGMARPKKAKVDAREEAFLARSNNTAAADEQGEADIEHKKQSGCMSAGGTKLKKAEAELEHL